MQPLCMTHRCYVGCYSLYVGVYSLYVDCHRRCVGCYSLYGCCTGVVWIVSSSMHDVQALCELLRPLSLTLTTKVAKCMARNPNPTTVAAIRPKKRWVAAILVGLGFLDTAL